MSDAAAVSPEAVFDALFAYQQTAALKAAIDLDLFTAIDDQARCVGYASSSRWRPKPAYHTTVEASVYCHPDTVGRRCGTALYTALFAALDHEDVQTIVAGVSLPNPGSLSFHERFGFQPVGVFHAVGRKFNKFWDVAWFERPLRLSGDEAR